MLFSAWWIPTAGFVIFVATEITKIETKSKKLGRMFFTEIDYGLQFTDALYLKRYFYLSNFKDIFANSNLFINDSVVPYRRQPKLN